MDEIIMKGNIDGTKVFKQQSMPVFMPLETYFGNMTISVNEAVIMVYINMDSEFFWIFAFLSVLKPIN